MFMAYASAARSAQLGRQVGAAVTTAEGDVLAVGFNEVPAPGGGAYWQEEDASKDARDHAYQDGIDSNHLHRSRIVDSVMKGLEGHLLTRTNARALLAELDLDAIGIEIDTRLEAVKELLKSQSESRDRIESSELKDITEYGRAVHAEMDALLTCSRLGISVKDKRLFTTTFPCHNCTRHIIASGVSEVTYIEPYPKSRARDLHSDAISFDREEARKTGRIPFLPFVGIGPRRYLDLFSADLSTGGRVDRKDRNGRAIVKARTVRGPRVPMLPLTYIEREKKLLNDYEDVLDKLEANNSEQNNQGNPAKE